MQEASEEAHGNTNVGAPPGFQERCRSMVDSCRSRVYSWLSSSVNV